MTVRVRRGPGSHGGAAGRPGRVFVADPSGLVFQLHDVELLRRRRRNGTECRTVEASPPKGLLAVGHEPLHGGRRGRSQDRGLLSGTGGRGVQAYKALRRPTDRAGRPLPDVHRRRAGRGGAPPPRAAHRSRVHVDRQLRPRRSPRCSPATASSPAQPARDAARHLHLAAHAESRRRRRRHAGALLTDPDGLAIQLQDVTSCGGGGLLGDVCPSNPGSQRPLKGGSPRRGPCAHGPSLSSSPVSRRPSSRAKSKLPPDINPTSFTRLPPIDRASLDEEGKRRAAELHRRRAPDAGERTGHRCRWQPRGRPSPSRNSTSTCGRPSSGPRFFELSALVAAREFDAQTQWSGHEPAGRRAGLEQTVIDAVKSIAR